MAGVSYRSEGSAYFERRGLKRYAGVWSLWALGVGAVISGHYSGWNLGFATGGFGGMLVAAAVIAAMYTGLVFCVAEMSAALPHTGAAYSFARTAMGPWGGFVTGLCENVEYVITPAVIVTFIAGYVNALFGLDAAWSPAIWVAAYALFLALNIFGVALSFRVTVVMTLVSLAVLVLFYASAVAHADVSRWALDIAADGSKLPQGHGSWFPTGAFGILATLPFAVWLFLAIEQLPLAAEESVEPSRDLPRGILAGMATLVVSAFLVVVLNPSVQGVGAHALSTSLAPLLDGFRAIYGDVGSTVLGLAALAGLIASFHAILFAQGRQVYSLSRAGYFPSGLSVTHAKHRTPHVAMIAGSMVGLAIMLAIWFAQGAERGTATIGGLLLNMAVFGAMFSYILQATSFILLRRRRPDIARPFLSPLGVPGAVVTIVIAVVTLAFQLQDPAFFSGVFWVLVWFAVGIAYFALVGRHRLILSPEEAFAMKGK